VGDLLRGEPAQFFVNERQQGARGGCIAGGRGIEEAGDVGHRPVYSTSANTGIFAGSPGRSQGLF